MGRAENIAVVRDLFAAVNRRDTEAALALVAPNFGLIDGSLGQAWYGREGWEHWLATWTAAVPDLQVELDGFSGEADLLVATRSGSGTLVEPLATPIGQLLPAGQWVQFKFADLYQVREGRLAQMRCYWDPAALMQQPGRLATASGAGTW